MKYLKIKNIGTLDLRSFFLIGASTKKNDSSKIGQFGTGLKYAISYFVRNNVNFKLFIGTEEVKFESKKESLRDKEFEVIYCNGQSMNITTEYGYQWQAWEAIREIWCNAKDEEKYHKSVKNENSIIAGEANWTTFFIEINEEVESVLENWKDYFVSKKPLFENDSIAIYGNEDKSNMKVYKNGVLVKQLEVLSLFHYDIKKAELNELRQYIDNPYWRIPSLLLDTNKDIISKYLSFIASKESRKDQKYFEDDLDWSWCFSVPSKEEMKKIFSGFMFLHPESNVQSSSKAVKVSKELFDLLKRNELPCEKIDKSSGTYYGGSSKSKEIKYKVFSDEKLKERINQIYSKRNIRTQIETAIPFDQDFEFVVEFGRIIFSTDLSVLSDNDLEAVAIIAYIGKQENGIYKAFKRLMKANVKNEFLHKIVLNEVEN